MKEIELTDREQAIAEHAADLAVKKMTEQFYQEVGRTVVSRWLIILGAVVVAFVMGKGWLSLLFK